MPHSPPHPGGERTQAAVLVPLFRGDDGELRVVLVIRGARGMHGGQLGLPGGKWERGDTSLLETALREAHEELGISRGDVEVVAELEPVDTRSTGFRVHPYLARIRPTGQWRLAAGEIVGVVTPRVRLLLDASAREERLLTFPGWDEPRAVRCVVVDDEHVLWGMTLRLLDGVAPRLVAGEWPL